MTRFTHCGGYDPLHSLRVSLAVTFYKMPAHIAREARVLAYLWRLMKHKIKFPVKLFTEFDK